MEQTLSTTSKPIKFPGPDHPITIERNPNRVVISVAGHVIADTRDALTLRESTYPPVQYVPRKDVDLALLERTDHATYCPYKGDCGYFSIPAGGKRSIQCRVDLRRTISPFTPIASTRSKNGVETSKTRPCRVQRLRMSTCRHEES